MKHLIIAEKPSVGRDIAKVLKVNKKAEGYLFNDEYIVSWAIGHLVTLCEPDEYDDSLKKWSFNTLPIIPENIKTKPVQATKKQLSVLKKLMNDKEVDYIICATDSGREGELIFRYIYNQNKCKKPFKRLWISSMTDKAISEGFENLKEGSLYDNLYISAKCRSEADWLVGINASRAFTVKYKNLLSIGRVQTPTLAILVKRQEEIDKFIPQDYWELEADFSTYKGLYINDNETKITTKEKAEEILNKIKGKKGFVESIEKETKKNPPPLLYDLTQLQRDCNTKYGFSAQKTLSLAQDLYEKRKLITYPRTDSRYLSDDMISKIKPILNNINKVTEYKEFSDYVLKLEKLPVTKRIVDNSKISDHHAIIPTEKSINLTSLSGDENKVFDLIVRRFMQVFYPQYIYDTTKIITLVEGESFLTRGTTIKQKGWTALNKQTEKDKEETPLPDVNKSDEVLCNGGEIIQKKTKPPQAYNEATLLSAMENAGRFVEDEELKEQLKDGGLGTPATRAAIIERLIKVGYVIRKGKSLIPTQKGMKLIQVVPEELKSPETTGRWEKGLTQISKGKMEEARFMTSIRRYVQFLVKNAKETEAKAVFEPEKRKTSYKKANTVKKESLGKCPDCGGDIYENTKAFYCSNWNNNCKYTTWKNALQRQYNILISKEDIIKLLRDKEVTIQGKTFVLKDNLGNLEIKK